MEQQTARKLARMHNGIAVQARLSPNTGNWRVGGWATKDSTWIVMNLTRSEVLFHESTPELLRSIVEHDMQRRLDHFARLLDDAAAEGDSFTVQRIEDAIADLLDEQAGVGVVAPCGDTFTTNSDAHTHAATCGACAGADELSGV